MVKLGKRETEPIIKELQSQGKQVVSFSRLSTLENCPYEAYLNYIKHKKGEENIYSTLGDAFHDKLQEIIDGYDTVSGLLIVLEKTLSDLDTLGMEFPKDSRGGTSIRDSWVADMSHFCRDFVPPKGEFSTEDFCLLKVSDDLYLQGYIDLTQYHSDGSISLWDWKTSSNYKKSDLLSHGRQLVLYAMAKEQEGFKVNHTGWIMLKYVEISFLGKARSNVKQNTMITKVVNRGKIVKELRPYLKANMLDNGMGDLEAELMLDVATEKNDLSLLPPEVVEKYTIKPYVRRYDLTDELRKEALNFVTEKSAEFAERGNQKENYPPRNFWKWGRGGKHIEDTFYDNCLCGYSKVCEYIQDHNIKRLAQSAGEDDELSELF